MCTIPERILPDKSTARCPKLNGFFSVLPPGIDLLPPGTVLVAATRQCSRCATRHCYRRSQPAHSLPKPRQPAPPSLYDAPRQPDSPPEHRGQLFLNLQRTAAQDGDFKVDDDGDKRLVLRFSCVANRVCLCRRRPLRFARHMTASLIASLLLRCKRRVPVAPSIPSLRLSHDGVAHGFASLALQGAVSPFASHVT